MINTDYSEPAPATPEQAQALLDWAKQVNATRVLRSGHWDEFEDIPVDEVPPAVAEHFPEPDPANKGVDYSVYPDLEMRTYPFVEFAQLETVDENLSFQTAVRYGISSARNGGLNLERLVRITEHGPHLLPALFAEYAGSLALSQHELRQWSREKFAELSRELQHWSNEIKPAEEALGLWTVSQVEAQQVIDFCRAL